MVHRFLPALMLSMLLSGCLQDPGPIGPLGGGSTHDTTLVTVSIASSGDQRVSVGVVDSRPEVLTGGKSENFLGTDQGNWAQTKDIKTVSGKPLAEDLTGDIVNGLASAGIAAIALPPLKKGTDDAGAISAFQGQGTDRLLLVRLGEWRTDSYTRIYLEWRLEASVFDNQGVMRARSVSQGKAPVGDPVADPGQKVTVEQLSRRLTDLLNEPQIAKALK